MPYKSKKKMNEYAKRWRRAHPNYQREYYRKVVKRLSTRWKPSAVVKEIEV